MTNWFSETVSHDELCFSLLLSLLRKNNKTYEGKTQNDEKGVCVCVNKNYEKSTNMKFFVVLCEVIRQSPRYDIEK
jgi:hypothetical protein